MEAEVASFAASWTATKATTASKRSYKSWPRTSTPSKRLRRPFGKAVLCPLRLGAQVAQRVPELKLPSAPRGLRRIFHQVLHEGLEAATPPASQHSDGLLGAGEGDFAACCREARAEALELSEVAPQTSALCAVDMAQQIMQGCLEDLRKIQLALLEL